MSTKEVQVNNKKYSISLDVSSLNHLCTFKELSNFKLTVQKYDTRFNEYGVCEDELDTDETNLVAALFACCITEHREYESSNKGILATMNTGNYSRWSYTLGQKKKFLPIFNLVGFDSSMVLYSKGDSSSLSNYTEVTMFNFNTQNISAVADNYHKHLKVLKDKEPEQAVEEQPTILTEQSIREYLQQGN